MLKITLLLTSITILLSYGSTTLATTDRLQQTTHDGHATSTTADTMSCQKLQGYFVKNTVQFDNEYKHVVVSNQKDFDQYFGVAKTMDNEIDKVDFAENSVIAILTKPSLVVHKIEVIYCAFAGEQLTIKYKPAKGAENSYKSSSLYLATIPKGVASVIFRTRYNVELIDVK